MTGAGLDTIGASQQTREHQRDAQLRLGACTFFVLWPALALIKSADAWTLHWLFVFGLSAVMAISVAYLASRRGVRIASKVQEQARADCEAYKEARLASFLAQTNNAPEKSEKR